MSKVKCSKCDGDGRIIVQREIEGKLVPVVVVCPACRGDGEYYK
jgi:DnaJ-class molecular chaperone